jgi:hypothetical protein
VNHSKWIRKFRHRTFSNNTARYVGERTVETPIQPRPPDNRSLVLYDPRTDLHPHVDNGTPLHVYKLAAAASPRGRVNPFTPVAPRPPTSAAGAVGAAECGMSPGRCFARGGGGDRAREKHPSLGHRPLKVPARFMSRQRRRRRLMDTNFTVYNR